MSDAKHRENNPAQKFQGIADADLLDELKRRKRIRVLGVERMYYTELATAEHYLDGVDADIARLIGRKVIDDKLVIIADREGRIPGQNSRMTIRDAKFVVIIPEQSNEKADPTPA
jgi:hypothetical protein